MTIKRTIHGTLAAAVNLLASCGSDDSSKPAATTAAAAATTAAAPTTDAAPDTTTGNSTGDSSSDTTTAAGAGTAIELTDAPLGSILQTADGKTLYLFTKDSGTTSACTAGCAQAWPPLTGDVTPGKGLDADDFSTITRDDGVAQVTFYGHPLYFFAGDTAPGDANGQGSNGVWYVVGADGNAIQAAAATDTSDPNKGDPGY